MNKNFSQKAPFLTLNIRWMIRTPKSRIPGSNAGYSIIESKTLPLSNSINERCMPHPGHSVPRKVK